MGGGEITVDSQTYVYIKTVLLHWTHHPGDRILIITDNIRLSIPPEEFLGFQNRKDYAVTLFLKHARPIEIRVDSSASSLIQLN